MSNILSDAMDNERSRRSGTTPTEHSATAQATAADLDEVKVNALANALTGAVKSDVQPQPTVSDQRKCETCGALEIFWATPDEDAETGGDDNEEDEGPSTQELIDDDNDFEDRKAKAVKAAVAKVRAEHIKSAPAVNVLKNAIRQVRGK
jgi:hypothetical protein